MGIFIKRTKYKESQFYLKMLLKKFFGKFELSTEGDIESPSSVLPVEV